MKIKTLLLLITALIISMHLAAQKTGSFTDPRDGKTYKTVKIGNQVWMAENLAYKPSSGNYWSYDNAEENIADYGYLYDWETAKKVCPEGWHMPTYIEWQELVDFLGGKDVAGGKLKETGTTHWKNPNTGATNESGFTALPGGIRYFINGNFNFIGSSSTFWIATQSNFFGCAWCWGVKVSHSKVTSYDRDSKLNGFSVRCLKD